jgi:hypothetical protein
MNTLTAIFGEFGLLGVVIEEGKDYYKVDRSFLFGQEKAQFNIVKKDSTVCVYEVTQEEFDSFAKFVNDNWQKNMDRVMTERKEWEKTWKVL